LNGLSSAGVRLWGFIIARTKTHRLKAALLYISDEKFGVVLT
jgi:hypothetical protein